jgi:hypothetical protein
MPASKILYVKQDHVFGGMLRTIQMYMENFSIIYKNTLRQIGTSAPTKQVGNYGRKKPQFHSGDGKLEICGEFAHPK